MVCGLLNIMLARHFSLLIVCVFCFLLIVLLAMQFQYPLLGEYLWRRAAKNGVWTFEHYVGKTFFIINCVCVLFFHRYCFFLDILLVSRISMVFC